MATHQRTTFVDRAANWILKQSWSTLALIAALSVGASVAVGSFAPANLVTTDLVSVPQEGIRGIDYSRQSVPFVRVSASHGSFLKADITDDPFADPGPAPSDGPTPTPDPYGDGGGGTPPPTTPTPNPCTNRDGQEGCACRLTDPSCNSGLSCSGNVCVVIEVSPLPVPSSSSSPDLPTSETSPTPVPTPEASSSPEASPTPPDSTSSSPTPAPESSPDPFSDDTITGAATSSPTPEASADPYSNPTPTPAWSGGATCKADSDCDASKGEVCEGYDPGYNSAHSNPGVCMPKCDESVAQDGVGMLRNFALTIFADVVHAQGAPRSQPCYRALLARITQGDLVCSPDGAARCASDGGKGCFKNPANANAEQCFLYSTTQNDCTPDKIAQCTAAGKICSACFGGCVTLSDFCDPAACAATNGECSPITLSCVPKGQGSCEQVCGQAGLSCVNNQCIQDRCRGVRCPSGKAEDCDSATGYCKNANPGDEIITDACTHYDINCPSGYTCQNLNPVGSSQDKTPTCVKTGATLPSSCSTNACPTGTICVDPSTAAGNTDPVLCRPNPCDPSNPENRVCPPSTICEVVGGYAECKSPANQVCDSIGVKAATGNDCVTGAECKVVSGVGQCVATNQTDCNTTDKKCPVGMVCDSGTCKTNRNECSSNDDCKASGMGLKTCQSNRCVLPTNLDPCYLTEMLNDSTRYGLSAGEVIEAAVYLQGKTCNRGSANTATGATLNELGLPFGTNVNGKYVAPNLTGTGAQALLSGSINMNSYTKYNTLNTNGSSGLANLCPTAVNCGKVGEVAFKKNTNTNGADQCECRTPTIADFVPGLANVPVQLCSNNRPLRRDGIYATKDGGTASSSNFADLNTGQEGAAMARESLGLPCVASEYTTVNGVLQVKASYVFCGDSTTDVTGCAKITTDGAHGYPTAQYVGGSGCNPSKAATCPADMDAIRAASIKDGDVCPVPPTLTRKPVLGMVPDNYEATTLKFQATLATGATCTMQVSDFCAGVASGTTVSIKWSDFAQPEAYCNGSNCVTASDGKKYTYGRGNLWPVGCTPSAAYSSSTLPTASPAGGGADSTRLAICPDTTTSSTTTQCKYPIHPWYSVSSTTYPNVTSDRLYAVFGGPNTFVPASCWRVEEYVPGSNDPWAASLIDANVTIETHQPGFLSRVWSWVKSWFGYAKPAAIATVTFPNGHILTAAIPPECMDSTKIGIGQKARTGTSAGTGVNNRLPQCRALLGLDNANTNGSITTTDGGVRTSPTTTPVNPPVINGRRYYAVPTCSGAGPSPLHPDYRTPSPTVTPTSGATNRPTPTATASGSPTATPTNSASCGSSCPSGQCKQIAGYGPFCVSKNTCLDAPSPCRNGNYMCVTDDGQWSCTNAALRPAGATCVTCDGTTTPTATPTPTSSATNRPTPTPSPSVAVDYLSIGLPDKITVGVPVDITVCAKDANGVTIPGYRGTIVKYIAETTPNSFLSNLPRYTFTAADNGCHTFAKGMTFVFTGEATVVAVDLAYGGDVYGIEVVDVLQATASPTPSASPSSGPTASASPTATPTGMLGDVNGDGRVTIADLSMVIDALTGVRGVRLTNEQSRRADVNCDNRLNLADVAKIANFIVTGGDGVGRAMTCSGS